MILIGQYDSPFVRRVGIALRLYDIGFEHRPWSTFGDADKLAAYNPLLRVPTLLLDGGDALIESHVILDYVDGLVPVERRMYPQSQPDRYRAMRISALATGMSDKAVGLFYEKVLHREVSPAWVERCSEQISNTLDVLEAAKRSLTTRFWSGESIGHADIAVAAAIRHFSDAHPAMASMIGDRPALAAHSAELEATPIFREISQPFIPPA